MVVQPRRLISPHFIDGFTVDGRGAGVWAFPPKQSGNHVKNTLSTFQLSPQHMASTLQCMWGLLEACSACTLHICLTFCILRTKLLADPLLLGSALQLLLCLQVCLTETFWLAVALSPMFPNTYMVGMEIRVKVSDYVQDRVKALRAQHPGQYDNIACIRTNAMKHLPNFFRKGQASIDLLVVDDCLFQAHHKAGSKRTICFDVGLDNKEYFIIRVDRKWWVSEEVYVICDH